LKNYIDELNYNNHSLCNGDTLAIAELDKISVEDYFSLIESHERKIRDMKKARK